MTSEVTNFKLLCLIQSPVFYSFAIKYSIYKQL